MKALVFAAGLGTRLRPLTDTLPKALVPVNGTPILQHVLLQLKEAGFDDVTINLHYRGRQIADFLRGNKNFGLDIHLSDESDLLLDTGGGILKARPWLDGDEPFLVHNADILDDADLGALYRDHLDSGADVTLVVNRRQTSRYLYFDKRMRLRGWTNAKTGELRPDGFRPTKSMQPLAFAGIHVIHPRIFKLMDAEPDRWSGVFPIIPFYLAVLQKAAIRGTLFGGTYWFDIGKPETLAAANDFFRNRP